MSQSRPSTTPIPTNRIVVLRQHDAEFKSLHVASEDIDFAKNHYFIRVARNAFFFSYKLLSSNAGVESKNEVVVVPQDSFAKFTKTAPFKLLNFRDEEQEYDDRNQIIKIIAWQIEEKLKENKDQRVFQDSEFVLKGVLSASIEEHLHALQNSYRFSVPAWVSFFYFFIKYLRNNRDSTALVPFTLNKYTVYALMSACVAMTQMHLFLKSEEEATTVYQPDFKPRVLLCSKLLEKSCGAKIQNKAYNATGHFLLPGRFAPYAVQEAKETFAYEIYQGRIHRLNNIIARMDYYLDYGIMRKFPETRKESTPRISDDLTRLCDTFDLSEEILVHMYFLLAARFVGKFHMTYDNIRIFLLLSAVLVTKHSYGANHPRPNNLAKCLLYNDAVPSDISAAEAKVLNALDFRVGFPLDKPEEYNNYLGLLLAKYPMMCTAATPESKHVSFALPVPQIEGLSDEPPIATTPSVIPIALPSANGLFAVAQAADGRKRKRENDIDHNPAPDRKGRSFTG